VFTYLAPGVGDSPLCYPLVTPVCTKLTYSSFGCLAKWVYTNNRITVRTKMAAYNAVSTLLQA